MSKKLVLLNSTIGNKDDLSPRVKAALEAAKFIAVEDTRWFFDFLERQGISRGDKDIVSFHDQSPDSVLEKIVDRLDFQNVYFLSEAGSPVISDPAFPLIKKTLERGYEIESLSGVSSVLMALELSGLAPHPFSFHGFFPRERKRRMEFILSLSRGSHFFFESPRRIKDALLNIQECFQGEVFVAKELSKTYESVYRFQFTGSESDLSLIDSIDDRGEFIFGLYKESGPNVVSSQIKELSEKILANGAKPKLVSKLISEITGIDSKSVYERLGKNSK